jgi:hypothetical protein
VAVGVAVVEQPVEQGCGGFGVEVEGGPGEEPEGVVGVIGHPPVFGNPDGLVGGEKLFGGGEVGFGFGVSDSQGEQAAGRGGEVDDAFAEEILIGRLGFAGEGEHPEGAGVLVEFVGMCYL